MQSSPPRGPAAAGARHCRRRRSVPRRPRETGWAPPTGCGARRWPAEWRCLRGRGLAAGTAPKAPCAACAGVDDDDGDAAAAQSAADDQRCSSGKVTVVPELHSDRSRDAFSWLFHSCRPLTPALGRTGAGGWHITAAESRSGRAAAKWTLTDAPLRFPHPPYVPGAPLVAGHAVPLDRDQANYLLNVLRLAAGDPVLVFNGRDGEWRAALAGTARRRPLTSSPDARAAACRPDLLFAPLKHARLDYMVQKAVEIGVARSSR